VFPVVSEVVLRSESLLSLPTIGDEGAVFGSAVVEAGEVGSLGREGGVCGLGIMADEERLGELGNGEGAILDRYPMPWNRIATRISAA
jgi:hypothetical protein